MNEYTLEKLAKATGGEQSPSEAEGELNINGINEILKNVSKLMQQYQSIRGLAPPPDGQALGGGFSGKFAPTAANTPPKVGRDIRIDQMMQYVAAMLRKAADSGMGDKPIMEVLSAVNITVNQAMAVLGAMQNDIK